MNAVETEIMEILTASRREMFGLEIVKASEKAGGKVKRGTVYVHLGRLEDGGLVASRDEPEPLDKDGLRRRLYKATQAGRAELCRRSEPTGGLAPA